MRLIIAFLCAAAPACADDAPVGDIALGQEIFGGICIDCHGADATGLDDAADIRGASYARITRATRGFDMMPQIDLTEAERHALAAYLATF